MRTRSRRSLVALLLALGVVSATPAWSAGRAVAYRTADGRQVTGLLMEASRRPAPAVVLLPTLGRPKDDWQAVAQRLADGGITALAVDLPGTAVPAEGPALDAWYADVRAAVNYLVSRGDVIATSIGMAGASFGATVATGAAAGDVRIRSIALVSPSTDYRGVRLAGPMRDFGGRPALLLASRNDPYATRSVRELVKAGDGTRETRWADVPAHGTALFAREPDLVTALVEWFQRTLA